MYGLTLSHEFQDIIKDCWNVYHDWLTILLDEPKLFLPRPIKDDALLYSKKMLWHLYNIFVPRKDANGIFFLKFFLNIFDCLFFLVPTKHSMICHAVLVLLEDIAKNSKMINNDLWENLLKFILAINNAVLALPYNKGMSLYQQKGTLKPFFWIFHVQFIVQKFFNFLFFSDDFCDSMSSRLVATLFEIWLIACNKNFPSPSLWKTFQEMCSNWRHHLSLVIEWNRVTYALTNRLLEMLWWPDLNDQNNKKLSPHSDTNAAYDIQKIINSMQVDKLIQSWFRFFHIIGNPIDFSNPIVRFLVCFLLLGKKKKQS
jgi:hypothetical protein